MSGVELFSDKNAVFIHRSHAISYAEYGVRWGGLAHAPDDVGQRALDRAKAF